MPTVVENPPVQRQCAVIGEGKIEILEEAGNEILCLDVFHSADKRVYADQASVSPRQSASVNVDGHCQLPGSLLVLYIAGQAPEDEVGLSQKRSAKEKCHKLVWSKIIALTVRPHYEILPRPREV